ncbi:30S ribosomal protein S16 [Eudoraea sp.]|uniref:30S ribosomal protein S16 n=1 Tax=Eudoraea sp. TaxID=1979955 RepID=UPI003C75248D
MPVRIRLQRHGKKGKPFYWIVAADARSKRDGKFLEKLGTYNPNTNPATIDLNVDQSVQWLVNGAQPSDTARRILSYKGVLYKHHLLGGVNKGALTEEQAEEKYNVWLAEKEKAVSSKLEGLDKAKAEARAKALEAEKEINEKRAAAAVEVEEETEAVVEEVKETVEEVKEAAEEKAEAVKEVVEEKVEAVKEAVEEKAEAVKEAVEEKAEAVKEAVEEVKEEAAPSADKKEEKE